MKLFLGLIISFAVGAGCRFFDIPVGSPPVIPGALLVVAMTLGYTSTNAILNRRNRPATTSHLCGGPTGKTVREDLAAHAANQVSASGHRNASTLEKRGV
jgi:XapX domain-containing protein